MAVSRIEANCCGGGGSGGAGEVNKFTWATQDEGYTEGLLGTETLLWQWLINFADAPAASVQVRMSGWGKVSDGVGTFNLRVGGTRGGVDGTVRATFSTSSVAYVALTNFGAAFVNPTGVQIVKLCLANDGSGQSYRTSIQGPSFSIG